jgi:hypothetical protein
VQLRQKKEVEAAWPKVVTEANTAIAKLPGLAKDVIAAVFARTTSQ